MYVYLILIPWNVKAKSLEEKCEADPLIVFVKSDLIIVRVNILHSGVSLGAPILICDTGDQKKISQSRPCQLPDGWRLT